MAAPAHPNDYERSDAEPGLIAWIALGLAIFIFATPFVLRGFYPSTAKHAATADLPLPPHPRLETKPHETLAALRAREDTALGTYGWTDRAHGVVRIPIDRAASLLSGRGLPGWPAQAAADAK